MVLYRVGWVLCRGCFRLTYGWRIEGLEHVPREGPALVVANHLSFLDPPLLGAALERPVHFMAKQELFRYRPIAFFLRRLNAFPVKRGKPDRAAIREALSVLEDGKLLAMFPEGTRSRTGELLPGQSGVAMLALRSRAPVIPVGIVGTSRVDRRKYPPRGRPRIALHFGEAVPLDDLYDLEDRRRAMQEAVERVMEAIRIQVQNAHRGRNRS